MVTGRVQRAIEFDYGHRLPNHDSECRFLHGHRGKLQVTVEAPYCEDHGSSSEGMVLDFKEIKRLLMHVHAIVDHRLILSVEDPLLEKLAGAGQARLCRRALYGERDAPAVTGRLFITHATVGVQDIKGDDQIVVLPYMPTAENIARWSYTVLSQRMAGMAARVVETAFWETPSCCAIYSVGGQDAK